MKDPTRKKDCSTKPSGVKNQLIQQGRHTDCIDELILKIANAPVKKLKVLSA